MRTTKRERLLIILLLLLGIVWWIGVIAGVCNQAEVAIIATVYCAGIITVWSIETICSKYVPIRKKIIASIIFAVIALAPVGILLIF